MIHVKIKTCKCSTSSQHYPGYGDSGYNGVSGYQFNCCLHSMRSVFSGVIDPKPSLSYENDSFLEKKLIFRVLLTKPINLLRIA